MADGLIHIPARKKQPVEEQTVVKLTPEAYNALVDYRYKQKSQRGTSM